MYIVCMYVPVQAFHEPAVDAGIILLNEVGLDPGIDHMLAAQCFDQVQSKGGKVNYRVNVSIHCLHEDRHWLISRETSKDFPATVEPIFLKLKSRYSKLTRPRRL